MLTRHLCIAENGSEEDFLTSYREDSFLVIAGGVRRGLEEIRRCYRQLRAELPNARYTFTTIIVERNLGLWSGRRTGTRTRCQTARTSQ